MSESEATSPLQTAVELHRAGKLGEAEPIYRQILEHNPSQPQSLFNLANLLVDSRRNDDAILLFERFVQYQPNWPQGHYCLANAQISIGQIQRAIASYLRAIQLKPDFAEALHNLGSAYLRNSQFNEAAAAYQRAIQLQPGFAEAYNNLAGLFVLAGKPQNAIALYQQAIKVKPDFAEAHNNLGSALAHTGQTAAAIESYRKAVDLRPNYAEAHSNLGNALRDAGDLDAAIASCNQALALVPNYFRAHNNLGNAQKDKGELTAAIQSYRRAMELAPSDAAIHSNLLYTLHFDPKISQQDLLAEHLLWAQRHADPLKSQIRPHDNDRSPTRRLRIGYVSPDFRDHPIGRFILPLLANHDRTQFEIFCYSSVRIPDAITTRSQSHTDVWRDISAIQDADVAEMIRQDRIDILVDLTMHMAASRLLVFARKPAPVQVTYLAYAGTTGLSAIDYRITDPYLDPPDSPQDIFTEKSIRLPHTYWCYEPPAENLEISPLPSNSTGHITFGCLNNFSKISADVLVTWANLLSAVPNSHLLLYVAAGSHRASVRKFFAAKNIDLNRLEFIKWLPLSDYLHEYNKIDIALDPFPYPGGTTTCDALWMGVPVITMTGPTPISRAGASILTNIGLPELIAKSPDEYVEIAARLANDKSRLNQLRSSLRQQMQSSPLMNAKQFETDFENAYRQMWKTWCTESRALT